MAGNLERIRLMELDLDIDLMLKKASESKKKIEEIQATVKKFSSGIKENQKLIQDNSNEMQLAQRAINRMQTAYDALTDEQKKNSDVGGQLLNQINQQKAKYNEAKTMVDTLSKSQTEYRKELELHQSELRKEQKEYSALKRQVDVVNKVMDESLGTIRTTDGSIDQLTQALAHNRKIYRSLPEDIRDNSKAGKELKKVIDEQDKAYKDLNSSIGVNQVHVGDYRGQLEDLFNSLKAGQPIIPALTTAFKGLYAQFIALAMNPIGATIAALTAIAGVTKMWYDYNLEMSKSTQLVQQFTGLVGSELQSITVKTRELAEVSGESEKAILQAVTATAKAYGISYTEAFQKVQDGWIRSGKAADDYFDNTSEYVTHFDNAGYSADEFFSILEAGAKNGTYKDKLVDTIKEFSLRFNDLPKSAKDAMEGTFGKPFTDSLILAYKNGEINAKQVLERMISKGKELGLSYEDTGAIVAGVMGAMGEDAGGYNKVVESINDGLSNTHRELTEVEKAQKLEIETTQLLEEKWASLFDQSGGTFEMLKAEGKAWLNGVLINLIDGVINFANGFIETYNKSLMLRLGINGLLAGFKNLGVVVMSTLKLVWNGLATTGNLLKSVLTLDVEGVKKSLSEGFKNVKDIVVSGAKGILNNAEDAFKNSKFGTLNAMTFNTQSFTNAIKENTDETKKNTLSSLDNAKAKDKKTKASKDSKKATDEEKKATELLNKEIDKHTKTLQEIVDAKVELALQELENDIKNREEKLKLEEQFTQDIYNANAKLFQDKHDLKLKEIEEEKRLNLQKIENEKQAEEKRINDLKLNEEAKAIFLQTNQEKYQAELDLINQNYNQKVLENDNVLNQSRKENDNKWNAKLLEEKKLKDDLEFQNKLLKIETDSQNEYAKKLEIENLQYEQDKARLEERRIAEEISLQEFNARKELLENQHAFNTKEIERSVNEFKAQQRSDNFASFAGLLGQESALGKTFYAAQITNDTYQKASQSFNQGRVFASNPLTAPLAPNAFLQGALTIAQGLGQLKKLVAPKLKFQDGGLLDGPSHAQGGIPFTINGQSGFEAEGGEYIINKKSTQQFLPLLNLINGKKINPTGLFQNGGIVTSQMRVNAQASNNVDYNLLASKIAEANRSLPKPNVSVAVTEINKAQGDYAKVEQRGNF